MIDLDALARDIARDIVSSDAFRAIKANAWDEGARAATEDYGVGEAVNPYRDPPT